MAAEAKLCVVTGGRGFAARHLVEMLLRSGDWTVGVADLAPEILLDPAEEVGVLGDALRSGRAQYVSADLRNKAQVVQAFQGAEAVFHMAAPDSSINNFQLHYSVNVEGTKNVIAACKECNVRRLIYTSSPSVIFDGVHGIFNGDESMPFPAKFIIGDGNNMYDFTYVENVAHGHICAEQSLASGAHGVAGQAFFITNMEPIKFWEFISLILEGLGYERPKLKIPASVVMPIAHLVEWIYKALSRYGMPVPQLTPSRIRLLSCNRTFSCSKAKEKLGYMPIVPLQDGITRTVDSFSNLRAEMHISKNTGPSKASRFLGNGKLADTLLWRDKRQTLSTLVVLLAFYYYFFASGYTLVTAISKILMLAVLFLFIHGILPAKILDYRIEKLSASSFQFSVEKARYISFILGSSWNFIAGSLISLCKGNDWSLFLKVVIPLFVLSFLAKVDLHLSFVLGVPVLFLVFYIYDRKEKEIDGLVLEACTFVLKMKTNFLRNILNVNEAAPKG